MAYRFTVFVNNNLDVEVEFFDKNSGTPFYFPPKGRNNCCQLELGSETATIQINPNGGTGEAHVIPLLQTVGGISNVKGGNGKPWQVSIKNSFKDSTTNITVGSKYPRLKNTAHA